MPDYRAITEDIQGHPEFLRRYYLDRLHKINGKRNVILYYSGWLHKPHEDGDFGIEELDKNGFMQMLASWSRKERDAGLDLILHTPGGDVSATESIGNYLRTAFNNNIRVIVPQLAMSGGTALACMGTTIIMGNHSSLGPTDPQYDGIPVRHIVKEYEEAIASYSERPHPAELVLSQFRAGLYTAHKNAIDWTKRMAVQWLSEGMFAKDPEGQRKGEDIANFLSCQPDDKMLEQKIHLHEQQINAKKCKDVGLNITMLEDNQDIQDAVLSLHHTCMWTFANTNAIKILENHSGASIVHR